MGDNGAAPKHVSAFYRPIRSGRIRRRSVVRSLGIWQRAHCSPVAVCKGAWVKWVVEDLGHGHRPGYIASEGTEGTALRHVSATVAASRGRWSQGRRPGPGTHGMSIVPLITHSVTSRRLPQRQLFCRRSQRTSERINASDMELRNDINQIPNLLIHHLYAHTTTTTPPHQ